MAGKGGASYACFTCCGSTGGTLRQRDLRRREQLGTVWTEHNLLALLQEQGLINQTT